MTDGLSMGVFVLGMHRSGTSCLAGMLQLAGFRAGEVSQWNVGNPRGNRENLPLNRINMALLNQSGGDWNDPPVRVRWAQRHRESALRLLEGLSHAQTPWVLKDPRTVLTLEFWLGLAPEARLLGVYRHPRAVVESLLKRNRMAADVALDLWCRYNERLLHWHETRPFPVLRFQADGAAFTRAAESALARLFPTPLADLGLAPEAMGGFFTAELVHHRTAPDPEAGLFDSRWRLPDALRERARGIWESLTARTLAGDGDPVEAPDARAQGRARPSRDPSPGTAPPAPDAGDGERAAIERRLEAEGVHGDLLERGLAALVEEGHDEHAVAAWLDHWLARFPGNPRIHWCIARRAWSRGEGEEAIWHAAAALGEIPGWTDPLVALGNWSAATGQQDDALRDFEALQAAASATLAQRNWDCARLYLDGGQGWTEERSVRRTYPVGESPVELHFDDLEVHGPVRGLRIDLSTRPLGLQDLDLSVTLRDGRRLEPLAVHTNAVLKEAGQHFFVTDSPRVRVEVDSGSGVELGRIVVSYRCHAFDPAALEKVIRRIRERVGALESELEAQSTVAEAQTEARQALETRLDRRYTELARLGQRLVVAEGDLADHRARLAAAERSRSEWQRRARHFDDQFGQVRRSLSWRIGARFMRLLMSPWTLGFGHTSLDDLERRTLDTESRPDRSDRKNPRG